MNMMPFPAPYSSKALSETTAIFLELDGIALVQEYKASVEERTPRPEVRTIVPAKHQKNRKDSKKKKTRQGNWPEITIVAGIIIFLLLIIWILM